MSPLRLVVFLFLCVCSVSAKKRYKPKDLNEAKANEVIQCFGEILCVEGKPLEFLDVTNAAKGSKEVVKNLFDELSTVYITKAEPTADWFSSTPDLICPLPKPDRVGRFTEFATSMGEKFKNKKCEQEELTEQNTEYCTNMDKLIVAGQALIDKYTEMKVCNNPERAAKTAQKEAQQNFGKLG